MKRAVGSTTAFFVISATMTLLLLTNQPASALVASRTYTLNADFDEGVLFNVQHDSVPDQLQLTDTADTYPVMWVPNAGEDTVSKWDTSLNKEIARYHTWFGPRGNHDAWTGPSPSRTCVDRFGNAYLANRHFDNRPADVIKVLSDTWIDRNGNGLLDTSSDVNNDGTISPSEMLQMTDSNANGRIDPNEIRDERIAWVVTVGPSGGLGRSLAIDRDGNIWLGLYYSRSYYKLDPSDGHVLAGPISVGSHTPYGALVDKNGILWGASLSTTLLRLDTHTNAYTLLSHSSYGGNYGIALGYDNNDNTQVYLGSQDGYTFIKYNTATSSFSTPVPSADRFPVCGIAVDKDGSIIASNNSTGATSKFSPNGTKIWGPRVQVNSEARGTIVDSDNNVWIIHRAANRLAKFQGSDGSPLGVFISGLYPYTYSDATGLSLQQNIDPFGTWTVDFDSQEDNVGWGIVSWTGSEPTGSSIAVDVRSSNDQLTWSSWETVDSGVATSSTPDGRYLQIRATFEITAGDVSPVLYDLSVEVAESLCGDLDYDGDVDGADRNILRAAFRTCTGGAGFIQEADYDGDGCITFNDYVEWYKCYKDFLNG